MGKVGKDIVNPKTAKPVGKDCKRKALVRAGCLSVRVRVRKKQLMTAKTKEIHVAWCKEHLRKGTDFTKWDFSDIVLSYNIRAYERTSVRTRTSPF